MHQDQGRVHHQACDWSTYMGGGTDGSNQFLALDNQCIGTQVDT